ncbi:hypothetical protein D3C81_2151170 [compost metagenome]
MIKSKSERVGTSTCVTVSKKGRRYVKRVNCPMKRNATAAMPRATLLSPSRRSEPVADI